MKQLPAGFASPVILVIIGLIIGIGVTFAYFQFKSKPASQPQQPTDLSSETPVKEDETADWETYKGKLINVSFKIPPDWTVEEKDGLIHNGEKINTSITISDKTKNTNSLSITQNFFGGFSGISLIEPLTEDIQISGIKAEKNYFKNFDPITDKPASDSDTPELMVIQFNNTEGVNFTLVGSWGINNFESANDTFDQILLTFQFIN